MICSVKPNLVGVISTLIIVLLPISIAAKAKDRSIVNRVLAVAHEMASAFQNIEDYTCHVETVFHQGGEQGETRVAW